MNARSSGSKRRRPPQTDEAPPLVSDHTLLRRIGAGSYGEVWLARTVTGAYRAVKIVRRNRFEDARPYEREYAGIRSFEPISRSHPALVHLLHVGRDDLSELFFYVMELGDNQSAATTLEPAQYLPKTLETELARAGNVPPTECLTIGLALVGALEHLHENGLIHRDVKPANVIFVNGAPKLADIGLVSAASEETTSVGTAGFMPRDGAGSPSSDLFSLGKTLYEMAFGKDRQEFPQLPENIRRHPEREILLGLNEIILKACANAIEKRYSSASQMRADLESLQNGLSLADLRSRRARAWMFAGAVGAALLFTLLSFFPSKPPVSNPSVPASWKVVPQTMTAHFPVNLSAFYNTRLDEPIHERRGNSNTLGNLPGGIQKLAGVPFSIGGAICLSSRYLERENRDYPIGASGIPIYRQCQRLYFLHANSRTAAKIGEPVAHIVVHYADRQAIQVPLLFGRDIHNWWAGSREDAWAERAILAWTGTNPVAEPINMVVRLFRFMWDNPRPEMPVTTIEYVSAMGDSASPFLVAVTAEGWSTQGEPQAGTPSSAQRPVNLAAFYNAALEENWHTQGWSGNDLAPVPRGRQEFGGVAFEVGGMVNVARGKDGGTVRRFPKSVEGIPVRESCRFLHLLHGSGGDAPESAIIGRIVIHYVDGSRAEMPIVYGEDVRNWWHDPKVPEPTTRGSMAWTGVNRWTQPLGLGVRLYQSTWTNPNPSVQIATVDFVSELGDALPFLLAITAEK